MLYINCYFHILIDHFSLEIICMLSSPRLQEPGLLQLVKALLCTATTFEGPNSNSLLPYFVHGPGNYTLEISTHVISSYGFSGIYSLQGKNTILEVKQQTIAAVIRTHTGITDANFSKTTAVGSGNRWGTYSTYFT